MSRDKIDVNSFIESKNDGSIANSDIMKALEDIDYDIATEDIDAATPPDEIDSEEFKEIEEDAKNYDSGENMEKIFSQESMCTSGANLLFSSLKLFLNHSLIPSPTT